MHYKYFIKISIRIKFLSLEYIGIYIIHIYIFIYT